MNHPVGISKRVVNARPSFRLHALAVATALVFAAPVALAGGPNTAAQVNASGLSAGQSFDRFIVKYRDGSSEQTTTSAMNAALGNAGRAVVDASASVAGHSAPLTVSAMRRLAVGAHVIKTSRKLDRVDADTLMRQIAANPNVEYVEVDKLNHPLLTPNDTNFSQQFGFGTGAGGTYATQAWDITSGAGTVVAVLDTGITNHSDLNANILPGYDFIVDTEVSNDGNGRDSDASDPGDWTSGQCGAASDSSWHGTHVAGTIAAVTNNAKGVAGMAHGAKIVPVRVLGTCGGYDSDIADAMIWASGGSVSGVPANANPAEVINLSLGGSGACSATTQAAINSAVSRGTTLVIAAGNSNVNVSGASPANCANVIAVGATTSTGARSSFSNYGAGIDVAAPGSTIMSTMNAGSTTPGAETYVNYSGTSMATPHVAGVVALMQSVATTPKTPAEIEALLKSSARAFPVTQTQLNGAGIVNAKAAVDAVNGTTPPPPTGGTLTNGVAVTGLSGAAATELRYTLEVPAGASALTFATTGGSGDADLYVKFGSAPTTSSYDCRPYRAGNVETCDIASAQAGTYHVMVRGYSSFSGISLTGSYSAGGGGGTVQTYSNNTDYAILNKKTVDSPITVSGRSGNGPSAASVTVAIVHTYKGDLKVDLVAPDGSLYNIHNRTGGSADNINGTFIKNLSSEALNGTWKLRVNDAYNGDTGYIDSWSITF